MLTDWSVEEPSGLIHERTRSGVAALWRGRGKFMSASFESSNGELWEADQEKPPFGLSIIPLIISCASGMESATARYMQSSTKPMEVSCLCRAVSTSGAL